MTPARFSECLDQIGWSRRYLATLLDCDHNLPARWATGQAPVPRAVAAWLERLARCHARAPVPVGWRVR
ncbi:MAG: hypothetical protein KGL39_42310 [Patescibacteria group bacterium]|nr:hypothetical protein [Patescibacteria group bacterium]